MRSERSFMKDSDTEKRSGFRAIYSLRDHYSKGRCVMLLSNVFSTMAINLSSGMFYTGFLTLFGINIVEIGILVFIPYIANCFSIFSPTILERFKKRRLILALARGTYHTLNILGVTLMPFLVKDPTARIYSFIGIVFLANIINALFSSGYAVWHLRFIPEEVRAEYFSLNTLITSVLGCGTSLAASITADILRGSAYEGTIIVALRIGAYIFAAADIFVLCLPKEYEYERGEDRPRLRDIFVKPFQHKSFALTLLILALYNFFGQIPLSSLDYFLLNRVGVEYTLISTVNMFYPLFLLLFLPFWKKVLFRLGWFRTFALGAVLHVPTTLLYSCISPANYMWVLPTVRLTQHFFGVGRNIAVSNLLYINMPKEDQTNYIAFHTVVVNAACFLGMMSGTSFVSAFPNLDINIFGLHFYNVQVLMWAEMFGQLLVPFLVMKLLPIVGKAETQGVSGVYVKKK